MPDLLQDEPITRRGVGAEPSAPVPSESLIPLESVLCTEELNRRPPRAPDYQTENRVLVSLAQALAESPRGILQTLVDKILEVLLAGSAGISLLAKDGKRFYWPAIAGMWKPHIGGGTPRDFGPCGDVLDRNAPLMFRHIERRYTYFLPVTPRVEECLLVPFYVAGKAVGTIWVIAHDERRKFDAEDLRQLVSLGSFASSAYQAVGSFDAFERQEKTLRQKHTELAESIAELGKTNVKVHESHRAALNLMEDAVQSRQAMEKLYAELRESEARYRTLFDLGPVAVYSIDSAGVIQNFNRRAAELWGRAPAVGDTDERFCGSFKLFRPDGSFMPHEECPMADVVTGRISEVHDAEVLIERPDGSRATVVVNIRPLKDARGEITGAINCFYDITGRKRSEEALKDLTQRLGTELTGAQRLQETSTQMIHGGDINALYEQILDAALALMQSDMASLQMLDPRRSELQLLTWRGFHPDSATFWKSVPMDSGSSCAAAMRTAGRIVIRDIEKSNLISSQRDLDEYRRSRIRAVQSTPLLSRAGNLIGMISTHWRTPHEPEERELRLFDVLARQAADLLERNRSEQALAAAQTKLSDRAVHLEGLVDERTARLQEIIAELEHFSYTITHDMRAPLRAMHGFGGLLLNQSGPQLPPESADYLNRIMEGARRMDALIQDSLQYAKVIREKIPLSPVDPAAVLRSILDSYPSLQPPEVKIKIVEPLPFIIANEVGVGQCFSNILINAVKFINPDKVPSVRVWAETRGEVVRIWFEDNGIGIPAEYHDRIFGMFQQLDKSYEGTGIGLALVRKTAERMHGKVGVESEPGKGSRFWLEFQKANESVK